MISYRAFLSHFDLSKAALPQIKRRGAPFSGWSNFCRRNPSEVKLERQLYQPWIAGLRCLIIRAAGYVGIGEYVLRVVEGVEELYAKFKPALLTERKALKEG